MKNFINFICQYCELMIYSIFTAFQWLWEGTVRRNDYSMALRMFCSISGILRQYPVEGFNLAACSGMSSKWCLAAPVGSVSLNYYVHDIVMLHLSQKVYWSQMVYWSQIVYWSQMVSLSLFNTDVSNNVKVAWWKQIIRGGTYGTWRH